MLTLDDLLDYCDLDREEIAALAEHEHIPMAIAAELGDHLLETPEGVKELHRMLLDNMKHAKVGGNRKHLAELVHTYLHLKQTHPIQSKLAA